jgi:hypothetical protein
MSSKRHCEDCRGEDRLHACNTIEASLDGIGEVQGKGPGLEEQEWRCLAVSWSRETSFWPLRTG